MHRLITRKKKIISYEDLDLLAITDRRNSIKRNPLILDCFHCLRNKARIYTLHQANVTQNKQYGLFHTTYNNCISPLVCRDTALSIYNFIHKYLILFKVTPTTPFTYSSPFFFGVVIFFIPRPQQATPIKHIPPCTRLSTFFYRPPQTNPALSIGSNILSHYIYMTIKIYFK